MVHNPIATPTRIDEVNTAKFDPSIPKNAKKPRWRVWTPYISVLGLLFISFIAGAAVIFFRFPLSELLSKAFMGTRAWAEAHQVVEAPSRGEISSISGGTVDETSKTFDGFTLYACASVSSPNTQISLINMRREVVHQWSVSFSGIWPSPPQFNGRHINDSKVCIFGCHPFANGDLLVVFHSLEFQARGCGLAKVDKDSKLIWSYAANIHHDVVVGDDGIIYAIDQRPVYSRPRELESVPLPWFVDYLVMLSPDGKEVNEPISILDALRNSPYSKLLTPLETPITPVAKGALTDKDLKDLREAQNVLHTNSVSVLSREMASKFPNFKAGQVLLSMRSLDAIAVLDPPTGSIVWGACGPWHFQHDAQFLNNGHMLLFDNLGSPHGSRVLEFEPQSASFPWSYPEFGNAPFKSGVRGMAQRLPNGNTLIVNSEEKQMFEVTQNHEVVWNFNAKDFITTARRYSHDQLSFLNAD
jgi:hypothetical protein